MSESRIKDELNDVLNKSIKFCFEDSFVINLEVPDVYDSLSEEFYSFSKKYYSISEEIDDFLKFLNCKSNLNANTKTAICILMVFDTIKSSYLELTGYYKSNVLDMSIYAEFLKNNFNENLYYAVYCAEDFLELDLYEKTFVQQSVYATLKQSFKVLYTRYINSQKLIRNQESIINFMNCNLEISKLKNSYVKILKKSKVEVKGLDSYIKFVEKYLIAEHKAECLRFLQHQYQDINNKINKLNEWIDNFNRYVYSILKNNGLNYSKYFKTDKQEVENLYLQLIQRLKKLEYDEYLQTTHWRNFREQAILFYQKCKLCNTQEKLCVHHSCYENIGKETFNDVVVLCESCHLKFHSCEKKSNVEINIIDE